jgi:hypothetical protein
MKDRREEPPKPSDKETNKSSKEAALKQEEEEKVLTRKRTLALFLSSCWHWPGHIRHLLFLAGKGDLT